MLWLLLLSDSIARGSSSPGQDRGANCRDSTYDYIDDYNTIPSTHKNNYLFPGNIPLHQQPRPESPYQDMKAADTSTHYTSAPQVSLNSKIPTPVPPNNNMHVTPGGSVVYRSRGSGSSVGEGDYSSMNSIGTPARQQELPLELLQHSVTLPENAVAHNSQPISSGDNKFSEC